MRCGAFHRVEGTLCLVRHGQAALSGSKTKAPGFAGGYLLLMEAGLSDLGRRTLMTIHTRQPNSSKPDKNRSTSRTLTAVALLCMTVALPSGSAIGQSGVSQNRLVGTWTYESIVVERTDGT